MTFLQLYLIIVGAVFITIVIWESREFDWKEFKEQLKEYTAKIMVQSIDHVVLSMLNTKYKNRQWHYRIQRTKRRRK